MFNMSLVTITQAESDKYYFAHQQHGFQITFLHQKVTISHQIPQTKTTTFSHQIYNVFAANF